MGAAADRYGADAMLSYFASHIAALGAVDVVLPEEGPLRDVLSDGGIRSDVVETVVVRKNLKRPSQLLVALLQLLPRLVAAGRRMDRGVDLVYVNTVTIPLWVVAAWLRRRPVVVHVHEIVGGKSRASRWARRVLYAPLLLTTAVVCVSEAVRGDVVSAYPVLAKRTVTILNANFEPPADTGPPTVPPTYDFVVVGRLSPRKGQHVVLEALKTMDPPPKVAMAGTPFRGYEWYEEELRVAIAKHDLPVDLLGYQPTSVALALAGAVIVPSTVPDPAPLVVIESLSYGRICIAANTGGIPELLGDAGLIFTPEDAAGLAQRMGAVLDLSSQARGRAVEAALSRAAELDPRFYWEQVDSLLVEVLA